MLIDFSDPIVWIFLVPLAVVFWAACVLFVVSVFKIIKGF